MMTKETLLEFQTELTDTIMRLVDLKDTLLIVPPEERLLIDEELDEAFDLVQELRQHLITIEIKLGTEEE